MDLFDIMRSAGGGDPFSALGRHYGLSEADVRRAMEAFLPAFSAGLKRITADPLGLMEFMRRLAGGDYQQAFQNPAFAFGDGRRQSEDALAMLFGSPAAAPAIAAQAAAFTGLAQDKLRDMMPALAAMLLGGLARESAATNPAFEAVMNQFRAAATPSSAAPARAGKGPLDRYEEEQARKDTPGASPDMQRAMEAGLEAYETGAPAWAKAIGDMAVAMGGAGRDPSRPKTEVSGRDVFGEMLEPGLRLSEAYRRELEALVERLTPDARRR